MGAILVIDDEESFVQVIKKIIERDGHNVICATSGKEGLEKLEKETPDLVILDIMMPELDGFEVCRRIREKFDTLPIIISSVMDNDSDIVKGLELGANDYFTKPINNTILLAKINSLLKFKNMEERLKEYSEDLEKKVEERTRDLKAVHDEIKIVSIAGLTGVFTALVMLFIIVLIYTKDLVYLGLIFLVIMVAAGLALRYFSKRVL